MRPATCPAPGPTGEYRDVLLDPAGRVVGEWPWQRNLLVDGLRSLLAALVKGDPQGAPIGFWAVGTGAAAWDAGTVPDDTVRRARTQLFAETGRRAVPPGQITFVGGAFTNRLEIAQTFTVADIPGGAATPALCQLREFGLFAGGTAAAGSGVLLNHRIHPRIDLQPGFTLQRTLRLTF